MSDRAELRCPNCRALVTEDADWCGQCFVSLKAPEPEAASLLEGSPLRVARAPGGDGAAEGGPERRAATWTCPTCEHENALEFDACPVCGTVFAALFTEPERGPKADPRTALTRSLIFPGLGHRAIGRGPDGLARGMLFAWTFGTTLLIVFSGVSSGPLVAMLFLYGSLAAAVYALSALEVYRMAQGGAPMVSSRVLLWFAVGLVLVSVLMATMLIFAAAKS